MYTQSHVTLSTSQFIQRHTHISIWNSRSYRVSQFRRERREAHGHDVKYKRWKKGIGKKSCNMNTVIIIFTHGRQHFPDFYRAHIRPHMFLLVKWHQVNICYLIYPAYYKQRCSYCCLHIIYARMSWIHFFWKNLKNKFRIDW